MLSHSSTFYELPVSTPNVTAFFIGRTPGLNVSMDRAETLKILRPLHKKLLEDTHSQKSKHHFKKIPFVIAEQIHGSEIAIIEPPFIKNMNIKGVDALITSHRGVILGIDVADCAPVWITEQKGKVGAIIHSGKKGTLARIVPKTIALFQEKFLISPADLIVTIGPCIRPPCYEVDFAKIIWEQATEAGVTTIHDEQICTACHPERYYSYRREMGKTGRMLATLLLE